LSELGTRTERTDGRTSNSLITMRNNKMIRHCWCRLKNVKLSLLLPFRKLTNPAVVVSFWSVTSRPPIGTSPVGGRCQSSAGHIFHSLMKHSIIVRLLWQWFLATNEAASTRHHKEFYTC